MKRIFILIFSILILKVTSSSEEPNIVYIMSDELAYIELSHMGNPYIKTPRIDRMVKEGKMNAHEPDHNNRKKPQIHASQERQSNLDLRTPTYQRRPWHN